ncbi:site-specific DNA-methyltransferase [Microbacterium phyllosphaerae]|uniref:site-specific DNA-methyltransferase n=1 Tax=Microbacterium phyllosphaerae TaxID=124798 RepID=UPI00216A049F|nr:DNA methyltransferase [Microbacterium phyllosphaerae]MCS3442809.1 adenine-specific DNA-methyltransferase [Microbacterium phyllosphaerae]
MSRLTDLLRAAKQLDPQLGADLEEELKPLQKRLPFGLNFERHAPEAVELPGHKIRKTSKVRILPRRGSTERGDQRLWRVESISGDEAVISLLDAADPETAAVPVDDLVLVAEFRDRIYPGLRPDGTVERGGDKPFHTVINGENFHVLEQLTFTHEHSVDAIYIDPPYNSGSKDWKYNNDYVEGDDLYRHSKWLAFMERRLKMAKRLLKPEDSVLIVTIDEKEYLRLGLLLEQTFPEARIQMVAAQIAPQGNPRNQQFYRTDEYVFFLGFGSASPVALALDDSWRSGAGDAPKKNINWASLLRTGSERKREDRPSMFYPIFVEQFPEGARIHSFGDPYYGKNFSQLDPPTGTKAVWPIGRDGEVRRWQVSKESAERLRSEGFLRAGRWNEDRTAIQYLARTNREEILSGEIATDGKNWDGSYAVSEGHKPTFIPGTLWKVPSHDATRFGTQLIPKMLPGRRFPFPKSLYAVEDALRFFLRDRPEATVLDFFAGSGTTAHAVMRLNHHDGGRRQSISVTNNEVSANEQGALRAEGLRPGDAEWEQWGICDYITKPRIRSAITGKSPEGESIKGDYKFVDEFSMSDGFEENAAFYTLTYESPWMVEADRAFAAIAPTLWLRAGAVGHRIDSVDGWAVAETYGVLKDLDLASEFVEELGQRDGIRVAYIVTDDEGRYQQVANELRGIETVRLYEDYLRNCESTGDL